MVDLQNLKNAVSTSPFSEDAKRALLEIIDSAIAKGSMSPEQKSRMLSIMDLEIEENDDAADVYSDMAEMLESFVGGVDAVNQTASDELDVINEENAEAPKQDVQAAPSSEPAPITETAAPVSETPAMPVVESPQAVIPPTESQDMTSVPPMQVPPPETPAQ